MKLICIIILTALFGSKGSTQTVESEGNEVNTDYILANYNI